MSNFYQVRIMLGLTQQELADLLHMNQSTLSNYECGRRMPSVKSCYKLIRLARVRNIDIRFEFLRPDM
jgi:Predicted transcriptional regulators